MIEVPLLSVKELRKYGLMMGAVIAGLFGLFLPFLLHRPFRSWPWFCVGFFWSMALLFPQGLKPIHRAWMHFGHFMGKINSTLILSVFYFVLFVPVALFFRVVGRDRLHRKEDPNCSTYRVTRTKAGSESRMQSPF